METLGILSAAFVMGLSSSGHCALMCGPIQSAWMTSHNVGYAALYHFGRLMTYVLLGLSFYALGQIWSLPLLASKATLMLGLSLVLGALFYLFVEFAMPRSWFRPLMRLSAVAGSLPILPRMLLFGSINGLLPCGMVWLAASLTPGVPSLWFVPLVMLTFLLGTLPSLIGVGVFNRLVQNIILPTKIVPVKLRMPLLVVIVGGILLFRGYYFQDALQSQGNLNDPEAICLPIHDK